MAKIAGTSTNNTNARNLLAAAIAVGGAEGILTANTCEGTETSNKILRHIFPATPLSLVDAIAHAKWSGGTSPRAIAAQAIVSGDPAPVIANGVSPQAARTAAQLMCILTGGAANANAKKMLQAMKPKKAEATVVETTPPTAEAPVAAAA